MAYSWSLVTPNAGLPARDGSGALVYNNNIYLIGGWASGGVTFPLSTANDVWKSPDSVTWTQLRSNTYLSPSFDPIADWEGRHTAGYVIFNNKMWIIGGDALQGHYQYDIWSSLDGTNWVLENRGNPLPWTHRMLSGVTVFNNEVWSVGGQAISSFIRSNDEVYREVWKSSDCINWTRVFTNGPIWDNRFLSDAAVSFQGKLWVIGGGVYDSAYRGRQYKTDIWNSSNGITWSQVSTGQFPGRQYHSVIVFDNKLWVLAGYDGANRNDVWYSSNGVTWTNLPGTPWVPRHAASVWVHNNALYIGGGHMAIFDIYKLTP